MLVLAPAKVPTKVQSFGQYRMQFCIGKSVFRNDFEKTTELTLYLHYVTHFGFDY